MTAHLCHLHSEIPLRPRDPIYTWFRLIGYISNNTKDTLIPCQSNHFFFFFVPKMKDDCFCAFSCLFSLIYLARTSILIRFFVSLGASRDVDVSTFGVKSLVESCVGSALGTMNSVFTVAASTISSPAPGRQTRAETSDTNGSDCASTRRFLPDPDPELKSSSSSG